MYFPGELQLYAPGNFCVSQGRHAAVGLGETFLETVDAGGAASCRFVAMWIRQRLAKSAAEVSFPS